MEIRRRRDHQDRNDPRTRAELAGVWRCGRGDDRGHHVPAFVCMGQWKMSETPRPAQRHLQPAPSRPPQTWTSLSNEVNQVLRGHKGPAMLYGVLATAWYEFASPEKARERARKGYGEPGDWIALTYDILSERCLGAGYEAIARWVRELADRAWPCPWGCGKEHPLIVRRRGGRGVPNRYRRWRCGNDDADRAVPLPKPIRRPRRSGEDPQQPLPVNTSRTSEIEILDSAASIDFDKRNARISTTETDALRKSKSLDFDKRNDQYGSQDINSTATAPFTAAADEAIDDVEAVAGEIAYRLLEFGRIVEEGYGQEQAWSLACRLAAEVLKLRPDPGEARDVLRRAVNDARVAAARNPLGFLRRGIVGNDAGIDRYLLNTQMRPAEEVGARPSLAPGLREHILAMLRNGESPSAEWLHERHITADVVAELRTQIGPQRDADPPSFPLGDALSQKDPDAYQRRLHEVLAKLPSVLGSTRSLDRPAILGMCRAQLEVELRHEAEE